MTQDQAKRLAEIAERYPGEIPPMSEIRPLVGDQDTAVAAWEALGLLSGVESDDYARAFHEKCAEIEEKDDEIDSLENQVEELEERLKELKDEADS
jgi:hypothetical protein